jgi:hypothetical protein
LKKQLVSPSGFSFAIAATTSEMGGGANGQKSLLGDSRRALS